MTPIRKSGHERAGHAAETTQRHRDEGYDPQRSRTVARYKRNSAIRARRARPVAPAAIAQAIACMVSGRIPISCAAVESSQTASIFRSERSTRQQKMQAERSPARPPTGKQTRGLDSSDPRIEGAADKIFRQ